jgi:hypothetical protein
VSATKTTGEKLRLAALDFAAHIGDPVKDDADRSGKKWWKRLERAAKAHSAEVSK